MSDRGRRGFRRVGVADVAGLELRPRDRARLELAQGWLAIVGPAVARAVRADRLQRGVLEVVAADARWAAVLGRDVPSIAAQLAAARPELGIRKVRLRVEGTDGPGAVQDLPPRDDAGAASSPSPRPTYRAPRPVPDALGSVDPDPDTMRARLERAAARLLERRTPR